MEEELEENAWEEETLLAGLKKRKQAAQRQLLKQYGPRLSEYFFRQFPQLDEGALEDSVYYILDAVIKNPDKIDLTRGPLRSYIYRAAKNRALDLHRKWEREEQSNIRLTEVEAIPQLGTTDESIHLPTQALGVADDPAPHSQYSINVIQEAHALMAELGLTDNELEHIRMRRIDKLQGKECAEILGISQGAERTRWFRLKGKIDKSLGQYPALVAFGKQLEKSDKSTDQIAEEQLLIELEVKEN